MRSLLDLIWVTTRIVLSVCMLPGSAILGAVAGGRYVDTADAMSTMLRFGSVYQPLGLDDAKLHDKRYAAFCLMQKLDRELRD